MQLAATADPASSGRLSEYLRDPFLRQLYDEISAPGAVRSILVDVTHRCNIRCEGCYFFLEEMDQFGAVKDDAEFEAFVAAEKARGTNFATVVGGEPSLMPRRVRALRDAFTVVCVTNGVKPIPQEGFEDLGIAVSVWGDHATDTRLRGGGKLDIFARALKHYQDDPRVVWYYTVASGNAAEVESVVEQVMANGNYLTFNYYADLVHLGGAHDHRSGFDDVHDAVNRAIEKYPDRVFFTSYMSEVITSGRMYGQTFGYHTCTSLTFDHPVNQERLGNGLPYNAHFRAYNADLSTRRCCVGEARDCATCTDTWTHIGWIMLNAGLHMGSEQEFTNWLSTVYVINALMRRIPLQHASGLLPEIHSRLAYLR